MFDYGDLNRVRTCDPHPVKMVLSQLSYQITSREDILYITKILVRCQPVGAGLFLHNRRQNVFPAARMAVMKAGLLT